MNDIHRSYSMASSHDILNEEYEPMSPHGERRHHATKADALTKRSLRHGAMQCRNKSLNSPVQR